MTKMANEWGLLEEIENMVNEFLRAKDINERGRVLLEDNFILTVQIGEKISKIDLMKIYREGNGYYEYYNQVLCDLILAGPDFMEKYNIDY